MTSSNWLFDDAFTQVEISGSDLAVSWSDHVITNQFVDQMWSDGQL